MKRIFSLMALVILVMMLNSCGWKIDGMDRLDEVYPPAVDGDCEGDCGVDPDGDTDVTEIELEDVEGDTLAGVWAMKMSLNGTMSPIGVPWKINLTNLFIVNIDEDESQMSLTFCDQITKIDGSGGLGETEIPAALQTTMEDYPIEIALPGDQSVSATTVAWTWGINLEDPQNDDISAVTVDDERIFDQDKDGNPGVTMTVKAPGGQRYMVRRAVWNLSEGTLSDDKQLLEGTLQFQVDEIAVGATSDMLMTVAPITSDTEGNTYALRRIAGIELEDGDVDGDEEDETLVDGDDDTEVAEDAEEGESKSVRFKDGSAITCDQLKAQYQQLFTK